MALVQSRQRQHPRERSPSSLVIRNVVVAGHRTSVRLEPSMWEGLRDIARRREMTLNDLVTEIGRRRETSGLTTAIRVYVLDFYRNAMGSGIRSEVVDRPLF